MKKFTISFFVITVLSALIGGVVSFYFQNTFYKKVEHPPEQLQVAANSEYEQFSDELNKKCPSTNDFEPSSNQSKTDEEFTYEKFSNELNEKCPLTSGFDYRECVAKTSIEKEKFADDFANNLERDVRILIEKYKAPEYGGAGVLAREIFLTSFAKLRITWKQYRDAKCETDNAGASGGSGHSGFINVCKLFETEKYIRELKDYRSSWAIDRSAR